MIERTVKIAGIVLGVLVGIFLIGELDDWREGRRRLRDAKLEENAARVDTARAGVLQADTVFDTTFVAYDRWRDRIVGDPATPAPVAEAVRRCDQVIATCQAARAARDTLITRQGERIRLLEQSVVAARAGPRFAPSLSPGWNPVERVPVLRAGAELRLFRKVSATATGDVTFYRDSVATTAFVGLTYRFK